MYGWYLLLNTTQNKTGGDLFMMTAIEEERLKELRKIVLKTGLEEAEWEKLEAMVPVKEKKVEVKK